MRIRLFLVLLMMATATLPVTSVLAEEIDATTALDRFFSLRRSIDAVNDLNVIIERYEAFAERYKELPAATEARKEIALWKDRRDRGMVKVGTQWVTPEQKTGMQEKALLVADEARNLLKQNRIKDAEAAVTKALTVDPKNVSALYIKGVIAYRQDKIPDARKAFETVKEIQSDHGPSLNNLAVVMWRQNQRIPALNMYYLAMQAMPLNKELLNNVAEALNALPEKERSGPVQQKVYKLWIEQDKQLQQQLMPVGLYRWGSGWVDKAQFDKLQAAEKEVVDKIAKMEQEYADSESKLNIIDAKIKANIDAMNYLERSRYFYDAQGRMTVYPLPPQYWDYDRANRQLEVQRKETLAMINALRAKAQVVKQQAPVPKFTGVQVAIGVEGTPAIPLPPTPVANKPAVPVAPEPPKAPEVEQPMPGNLIDQLGGGPQTRPATNPSTDPSKETPPKVDNRPLKF